MYFDDSYREELQLKDGTPVLLRMVCPRDKELLRQGFERLSSRSRYLRFFTTKVRLTDKELDRLVDVDGFNHVAIGAVLYSGGEEGDGIGVARFVRLKDDPRAAEPAITVIDDYQGRGLGTILLQRIIAAARERDIERFRSEVLVENENMRLLLGELNPDSLFVPPQGGVSVIEIPLPETFRGKKLVPRSGLGSMRRLLSEIASGEIFAQVGDEIIEFLTGEKWWD